MVFKVSAADVACDDRFVVRDIGRWACLVQGDKLLWVASEAVGQRLLTKLG